MCSSRRIIFVTFLSVLSFCACASRPKLPTQPTPDVRRVLSAVEAQGDDLRSFRGAGTLKAARGSGVKSLRAIWIGSKPQNLRLETLGPWGQPYLTLVVHGPTFALYSHQEDRHVTGKATKRNLSRFASVPMRPEDLFALLSGRPPVLPFHRAKIRISKSGGGWLISLYKTWGRLVEKIWLKEDETTVERVEVLDGWGHLQYRIAFSQFLDVESFHLPHRIEIADSDGPLWSVMVERFWTNIAIPDGAYTLNLPAGKVTDLDS
jgi:outer membrane lipoprotein-sorting protein